MKRRLDGAAAALVAVLALTSLSACGGDKGADKAPGTGPSKLANCNDGRKITVGSETFTESILLAEMYAQALEARGCTVEKKLKVGSREVYYGQVVSGGLGVVPEYNGSLLAHVDKNTTAKSTEEVNAELTKKLPESLVVGRHSAAQDKDCLVVTKETATKHNLKAIGDLAPVAKDLVVGAAPEFKTRQKGVPGLEKEYGVTFKSFKSLDSGGPVTQTALKSGDVQAANLYSTNPAIARNGWVVLEDPKNLFGAENILPLFHRASVDAEAQGVVNVISDKITEIILSDLIGKIEADKRDPDKVARDWLRSVGLV